MTDRPSFVALIQEGPSAALADYLVTVDPETALKALLNLAGPLSDATQWPLTADARARLVLAEPALIDRLAPGDLGPVLLRALEWNNCETAQRLIDRLSFTSGEAPKLWRHLVLSRHPGTAQVAAQMTSAHLIEAVQQAMGMDAAAMIPTLCTFLDRMPAAVVEAWCASLERSPAVQGAAELRQTWTAVQRSQARAAALQSRPTGAARSRPRS